VTLGALKWGKVLSGGAELAMKLAIHKLDILDGFAFRLDSLE
jgi:hypothetical protein